MTSNEKLAEIISTLDAVFRRELVADISSAVTAYGEMCRREGMESAVTGISTLAHAGLPPDKLRQFMEIGKENAS